MDNRRAKAAQISEVRKTIRTFLCAAQINHKKITTYAVTYTPPPPPPPPGFFSRFRGRLVGGDVAEPRKQTARTSLQNNDARPISPDG